MSVQLKAKSYNIQLGCCQLDLYFEGRGCKIALCTKTRRKTIFSYNYFPFFKRFNLLCPWRLPLMALPWMWTPYPLMCVDVFSWVLRQLVGKTIVVPPHLFEGWWIWSLSIVANRCHHIFIFILPHRTTHPTVRFFIALDNLCRSRHPIHEQDDCPTCIGIIHNPFPIY